MVLEALYSWNYDQVQWLPADPDGNTKTKYGLSALPTVFKPANDILPSVANTGYADFAFSRMPAIAINNEHQFSSSLTWTRGSHIIKFGGQHIRNYKDEIDSITDGGDRGTYDFGVSASAFDTNYGPSNVLTGALSRFQQVQNIKRKNAIYTDIHVFVQDTWKVKSNLTFDYGVRFYHVPTQHETPPGGNAGRGLPAQPVRSGQGAAILYVRPHQPFGGDRSGESRASATPARRRPFCNGPSCPAPAIR